MMSFDFCVFWMTVDRPIQYIYLTNCIYSLIEKFIADILIVQSTALTSYVVTTTDLSLFS